VTRVLLDTNVVLDFLLDRVPFADAAAVLWQANDAGEITASFAGAPAGSFTVDGASFGRDSLALEFYSAVQVNEGVGLTMTYDGDIASHSATHMFSGGVNLAW
jgi:uncharacterized protein with beta-barrel porin domain